MVIGSLISNGKTNRVCSTGVVMKSVVTPLTIALGLACGIPALSHAHAGHDDAAPQEAIQAPLLAVFPGVAIALAVLGLNLLGDGLRDLLDPRLARKR